MPKLPHPSLCAPQGQVLAKELPRLRVLRLVGGFDAIGEGHASSGQFLEALRDQLSHLVVHLKPQSALWGGICEFVKAEPALLQELSVPQVCVLCGFTVPFFPAVSTIALARACADRWAACTRG